MDLAEILIQLWRRRRAVVAVIVFAAIVALAMTYRFSLSPLGLTHRSVQSGTAETKILVDWPRSGVADLNRDFAPLTARAQVLSQLMTTSPVVSRIEQIAGLPRGTVTAASDNSALNVPTSQTEPSAERRANDIAGEGQVYRVTFRAEPEQPTITIFAQAPTADLSRKLADAAAQGGAAWVRDTQQRQFVPDSRRTQLTQLGQATSGVVNTGASRIIAALVFLAIVGVGCLLILLVGRTLPAVRAANRNGGGVDTLRTVRANGARANANGAGSAKRAKTAGAAASGSAARSAQATKSGRPSGRRAS